MENFFTIVITSGIAGAIASTITNIFIYQYNKKKISGLIKEDIEHTAKYLVLLVRYSERKDKITSSMIYKSDFLD